VFLDYLDWQTQSRSFDALAVMRGQSVNLTGGDHPERVIGSFVSANIFPILGAAPEQGRFFTEQETVVAITRPDLYAPLGMPDVWMPIGYYPNAGDLELRGRPGVLVVGRLKAGV